MRFDLDDGPMVGLQLRSPVENLLLASASFVCLASDVVAIQKASIRALSGLSRSAGNSPQPASQDHPEPRSIPVRIRNRDLLVL